MRMRLTRMLTAAVVGVTVTSALTAEQERKTGKRFWFRPKKEAEVIVVNTLAFMDRDKNGVVDGSEFYEHVKTYSFRRLDVDGNGEVSKAEWLAVETGPEGEKLFGRWDKNGDGKLTLGEFKDTPEAKTTIGNLFKTLDVDGDGKLSAGELEAEVK